MTYYTNEELQFTANITGGVPPYTIDWDFGDGTVVKNASNPINHAYSQAGTYTVTVTVTDSIGETASAQTTITVEQAQSYITLTFTESGLPSGVTWSVDIGGVTYSAESGQDIVATLPSGSYSWSANEVIVNTGTGYYYYYSPSPSSGTADKTETIPITYSLTKVVHV